MLRLHVGFDLITRSIKGVIASNILKAEVFVFEIYSNEDYRFSLLAICNDFVIQFSF